MSNFILQGIIILRIIVTERPCMVGMPLEIGPTMFDQKDGLVVSKNDTGDVQLGSLLWFGL